MIARRNYNSNGTPVYCYCNQCGSKDMRPETHTSLSAQGQVYLCMTCGSVEINPAYEVIMAGCYDLSKRSNIESENWIDASDLAAIVTVKPFQKN
jgi:hypothetical protein